MSPISTLSSKSVKDNASPLNTNFITHIVMKLLITLSLIDIINYIIIIFKQTMMKKFSDFHLQIFHNPSDFEKLVKPENLSPSSLTSTKNNASLITTNFISYIA